jgi:hypothetical protein
MNYTVYVYKTVAFLQELVHVRICTSDAAERFLTTKTGEWKNRGKKITHKGRAWRLLKQWTVCTEGSLLTSIIISIDWIPGCKTPWNSCVIRRWKRSRVPLIGEGPRTEDPCFLLFSLDVGVSSLSWSSYILSEVQPPLPWLGQAIKRQWLWDVVANQILCAKIISRPHQLRLAH